MAHIPFPDHLPGILGPLLFQPETAAPLNELAEVLLRGDSTLTRGERELIAALRVEPQRLPVLPDVPQHVCRHAARRRRWP